MARRAITATANAIGADPKAELFNVIDFSSSGIILLLGSGASTAALDE